MVGCLSITKSHHSVDRKISMLIIPVVESTVRTTILELHKQYTDTVLHSANLRKDESMDPLLERVVTLYCWLCGFRHGLHLSGHILALHESCFRDEIPLKFANVTWSLKRSCPSTYPLSWYLLQNKITQRISSCECSGTSELDSMFLRLQLIKPTGKKKFMATLAR